MLVGAFLESVDLVNEGCSLQRYFARSSETNCP
jgi:hypothetical protein